MAFFLLFLKQKQRRVPASPAFSGSKWERNPQHVKPGKDIDESIQRSSSPGRYHGTARFQNETIEMMLLIIVSGGDRPDICVIHFEADVNAS